MLKIGEFLFKFRDYTPIPFIIVMIVFCSTSHVSLAIGTFLMILGELIRIKGVSHIGGISRTKTYSTGQKLIVSGPFAHVRNPLYIGNFFLSVGLVIVANVHPAFTLLFIIFFFVQYIPIVRWEESNLKNRFGDEFTEYMKSVPRWIPSVTKKMESNIKVNGEYKEAIKSEKNTLAAAILLYLIFLWRGGYLDPVVSFFKQLP